MVKILYILDNTISKEIEEDIKIKKCDVLVLDVNLKKYLEKRKIKTVNEDEILNFNDYEEIDKETLNFSRNWFLNNHLEKILEYNQINIGLMLQNELFQNILKYLHRIKLIQRTLDKNSPGEIFTFYSGDTLGKIPYEVCISKKIRTNKIRYIKSKKQKNKFDSVNFSINIFKKNHNITISKKKFVYLKKIVEGYWYRKYNFITNIDKKNKTIMFLDFNVISHEPFLRLLNEKKYNLFLLNNRRPIIWNKESLNTVKKLKISKVNLSKLEKKEQIESIEISNRIVKEVKNIDLTTFFKFNEFDFWSIFKDELETILQKRTKNIIILIKKIERFIEKTKIDIVWTQDDWGDDRIIVRTCQQNKIPVCMILAGSLAVIRHKERMWNLPSLVGERHADKLCIWGDNDKKNFIDYNSDMSKIVIGGAPKYDELYLKETSDQDYILILTGGFPSTQNSYFFSTSLILNFEKILETTLKEVKKFNKKIIIKRHPTQGPQEIIDLPKMFSNIIPEATVLKEANTIDLISKASLVITVYSTVLEESIILQKPIIFLPYLREENGIPYTLSEAVIQINNTNEINQKIHDCLYDDITREKLKRGREKFLKKVFSFQTNASKKHVEIMEEVLDQKYNDVNGNRK